MFLGRQHTQQEVAFTCMYCTHPSMLFVCCNLFYSSEQCSTCQAMVVHLVDRGACTLAWSPANTVMLVMIGGVVHFLSM